MSTLIRALLVDDEPRARILLRGMLKEYAPQVEVVGESEDVPTAVKAIHKLKPDLVFLDIEMPGHSGLELHDFFNATDIDFDIIFTTAYSEYALRAFKLSAVDYLLKPIDATELEAAVNRYQITRKRKIPTALLSQNLKHNHAGKIAVPVGTSIKLLDTSTILFLKADSSYTELKLEDKSTVIVSRTLKNFEDALVDNAAFFRCHKSYLVNTAFVKEYVKSDGGYLLLSNNETVPLSPEKAEDFLALLKVIKRN
jgi:two-component system, LytTR family, response regulator